MDVVFSKLHARWAAVDDAADGAAVRFSIADIGLQLAFLRRQGLFYMKYLEAGTYVVTRKAFPKDDMLSVFDCVESFGRPKSQTAKDSKKRVG